MYFTKRLGKYEIDFNTTAKCKWSSFKIHKPRAAFYQSPYSTHIAWGKLSFSISNLDLIEREVCKDCGSDDISHSMGDGISFCNNCQSVENTTHMTFLEWENAST